MGYKFRLKRLTDYRIFGDENKWDMEHLGQIEWEVE